jgi:hypothetical protein
MTGTTQPVARRQHFGDSILILNSTVQFLRELAECWLERYGPINVDDEVYSWFI